MHYFRYPTKIGLIGIAEDSGALVRVWFETETARGQTEPGRELTETPLLKEAYRQLCLYFDGKLRHFTLPLAPVGTPFQQSVWNALLAIPYGATASYSGIASAIRNPKACRAVGMANNKNLLPIFIPCHRVIGKTGTLTGYAGGLDIKQKLLEIESAAYVH